MVIGMHNYESNKTLRKDLYKNVEDALNKRALNKNKKMILTYRDVFELSIKKGNLKKLNK